MTAWHREYTVLHAIKSMAWIINFQVFIEMGSIQGWHTACRIRTYIHHRYGISRTQSSTVAILPKFNNLPHIVLPDSCVVCGFFVYNKQNYELNPPGRVSPAASVLRYWRVPIRMYQRQIGDPILNLFRYVCDNCADSLPCADSWGDWGQSLGISGIYVRFYGSHLCVLYHLCTVYVLDNLVCGCPGPKSVCIKKAFSPTEFNGGWRTTKKASQIGSKHPRYKLYGFHGVQRGARGDGPELSHYCCSTPILGCLHAAAARSCYGRVRKYGVRGDQNCSVQDAGCVCTMHTGCSAWKQSKLYVALQRQTAWNGSYNCLGSLSIGLVIWTWWMATIRSSYPK